MTDALRTLIRRSLDYPHLARKYAGLDLSGDFDLRALPEMDRTDVTTVAEQSAARRPREAPAYLFTSGGSTAEPKLAWIPTEMHLGELTRHWQPLSSADVFANLATPGRLWSAHYCYNRLAELAGADVIGLGHIPDEELERWLDFLSRHGTTAIAGTPSQILRILMFCERTGHGFAASLRAAIWFGEPCDPALPALRDEVAPDLGLWGNYGSTETWVIGHSGPECPPGTFHVLPYQHVELVDGAVLVSTLHPGAAYPLIRYRIGDRAEWAGCPCARPDALRVIGREGSLVKFAGTLVSPQQLVEIAKQAPGVRAAQAVLEGADGVAERLEIHVVGTSIDTAAVRRHLLDSQVDLEWALRGDEESFSIRQVESLSANARTGKTPDLLWTAAG